MSNITPPPIREDLAAINGKVDPRTGDTSALRMLTNRVWVQWFTDQFNKINERIEQIVDAIAGNLPIADSDGSLVDSGYDPTTLPYFLETEFIDVSAGAADTGKPIILDADGQIDATMVNDGDIDHGSIGGLDDIADHPSYVSLDGTREMTADWNIGDNALGIGIAPTELLHLTSATTLKPVVKIVNTNADELSARIEGHKVSASPADDDQLLWLGGYGKNDADAATELFSKISFLSLDISDDHIGGGIRCAVYVDNTQRNLLDLKGYNGAQGQAEVIINEEGIDCDTRIETAISPNTVLVDGATGVVAIGDGTTNYAQFAADGDLTFVGTAGLPFGSCSGYHMAWAQAAAQNTWYNVSDLDFIDGQLNDVTHDGSGKLTVGPAGKYLCNVSFDWECDAVNKHIEVGFEIEGGGSAATEGIVCNETKFANEEHSGSTTAILDLAAGETLEFCVRTTDIGAPTITVDCVNLNCVQIGGT